MTRQPLAGGRIGRAIAAAAANGGAKAVQFLVVLATVPLLLAHLGPDRFTLWAAASAINVLLLFADLGLGNGLTTTIAQAMGREDRAEVGRLVSDAAACLVGCGLAILIAAGLGWRFIDWAAVFGVSGTAAAPEAAAVAGVLLLGLGLGVPLTLAARIRNGLQQGWIAGVWDAGAQLASGLALVVVARSGGGAPAVLAAGLGPLLAIQAVHLAVIMWRHPWLRPGWNRVRASGCLALLRTGGLFAAIQAATAVVYSCDVLLCSHVCGPVAAADLAVVLRLFAIPSALASLMLAPLWPAYGEALTRGDHGWIRSTWRRSLWLAWGVGVAALLIGPWLVPWLLRLWIGAGFVVDPGLVWAGCAAFAATSAAGAASMLLNGAGRLATQAWCGLILVVVAMPLKVAWAAWAGPAGLVWSTAVVVVLVLAVPLTLVGRRLLHGEAGHV